MGVSHSIINSSMVSVFGGHLLAQNGHLAVDTFLAKTSLRRVLLLQWGGIRSVVDDTMDSCEMSLEGIGAFAGSFAEVAVDVFAVFYIVFNHFNITNISRAGPYIIIATTICGEYA